MYLALKEVYESVLVARRRRWKLAVMSMLITGILIYFFEVAHPVHTEVFQVLYWAVWARLPTWEQYVRLSPLGPVQRVREVMAANDLHVGLDITVEHVAWFMKGKGEAGLFHSLRKLESNEGLSVHFDTMLMAVSKTRQAYEIRRNSGGDIGPTSGGSRLNMTIIAAASS